jgi:hypothetical protein
MRRRNLCSSGHLQQAAENAEAMAFGPLPSDVADTITRLLADSPERP